MLILQSLNTLDYIGLLQDMAPEFCPTSDSDIKCFK